MSIPLEHLQGKYEILEKLQEGGMGAVYKVRHRLLEEVRVIKVVRPQFKRDEDVKARFLREARTAIRMRHKNIAQLYDFSIDPDENAFIVMEFIDGITFQDLLRRRGVLPLPLTLEMARQTLEALRYLHRRNTVHRDIAPDNLMLSRDEDLSPLVKLIDLGVAKALEGGSSFTVAGTFLGKVRYASPEQFRTQEGVTVEQRSDLYSFGVVLYELLTGKLPVRGSNLSSLIAGHLLEPPIPFAETDPDGKVPEELRALVMHTLAKRPEDRPANASAAYQELVKIQARFPLEEGTLEDVLNLDGLPTSRLAVVKPGSTQNRLDEQFHLSVGSAAEDAKDVKKPAASSFPRAVPTPGGEDAAGVAEPEEEEEQATVAAPLADSSEVAPPASPAAAPRADAQDDWVHALVSEVESLLAQDDPAAARRALEQADADAAASSVVARLEEQVQRREGLKDVRGDTGSLLVDARLAAGMGDDEAAAGHLEAALRLDPDSTEASRMLAKINRRREERRSRDVAVSEALAKAEAHLEAGRIEEAERLADRIATRLGDADAGAVLRERIQAQRQRSEQETVSTLLRRAREAADAKRFAEAIASLEEALRISPDDTLVKGVLASTTEAQRSHEDAQESARAIDLAARQVRRLLDDEKLDEAQAVVQSAVTRLGEKTELTRLGERVSAALAAARAWGTAREAAQQARELLRNGNSAEALAIIDSARRGVEGQEEIDRFLVEEEAVVRAHLEELRRERELTAAKRRIEGFLDNADLVEAERALSVAEKLFPRDDEILVLRRKLEWAAHEARQASTTKVIAEARRLAAEGKFGPAQRLLNDEQSRHPHNAHLSAAVEELRRDEAAAAVETKLNRGDLEGARRALDLADKLFADDEVLRALRQRLESRG